MVLLYLTKYVQKILSMITKETFGMLIRKLREEHKLPLRKVAAVLDIDPSTLSKIERDERSANKDMISKLAELFTVNSNNLSIAFLSDKVVNELISENCSNEILRVAEEKIEYIRAQSAQQGKIEF